jgi:hypothetical protein
MDKDDMDAMDDLRDTIDALTAERDALRSDVLALQEQRAQQLAACDCAALLDTPESHATARIERDNPFWSPAYESVMRRTSECISLRTERDALVAQFSILETQRDSAKQERDALVARVRELEQHIVLLENGLANAH